MRKLLHIVANLQQKLAAYNEGYGREEHIQDHIILLDWVLRSDGMIRNLGDITHDPLYELTAGEICEKMR